METGHRSYSDVVEMVSPALFRLALMLTGDVREAEDLLQSTLLRALPRGERVANAAAPAAYLRRVMLNEHVSRWRRSRRRVHTVPQTDELPDAATESDIDTIDRRDEVWRWLATLKPLQRAVLVLRYYEDLSDREIARSLRCAQSTVRSHAFRGLAGLRRHISELEVDMEKKR